MPEAGAAAPWAGVRLHVVTGKGGTGKTTVAAALALALADAGRRVLLVEVESRQGIAQTLDVPPLAQQDTRIARGLGGGEVWGLSVDAKAALLEYLQLFYKLGRAGSVLERFGAIDFATTIAPGVRDVLLTGKVYEAVRRRSGPRTRGVAAAPQYDAVVLDAPPTGRVVRFLDVNREVSGLARVGPIHSQADSITALLQSSRTVVHIATLLEEMPVQESIDTVAELEQAGLRVGGIVVDQVRSAAMPERAYARLAGGGVDTAELTQVLADAGLRPRPAMVNGLLEEGGEAAGRRETAERELARINALRRPTYQLPLLSEGVDASGIRALAGSLAEQGMA